MKSFREQLLEVRAIIAPNAPLPPIPNKNRKPTLEDQNTDQLYRGQKPVYKPNDDFTRCEVCGAKVKQSNLIRHKNSKHRQQPTQKPKKTKNRKSKVDSTVRLSRKVNIPIQEIDKIYSGSRTISTKVVKERPTVTHIKEIKTGPGRCSVCGNPAIPGDNLCYLHAKQ